MYCQRCESNQKCVGVEISHLLHFFMSVATAGVWLLVWFFLAAQAENNWSCDVCGVRIVLETKKRRRWREESARREKEAAAAVADAADDPEPKRYDIG